MTDQSKDVIEGRSAKDEPQLDRLDLLCDQTFWAGAFFKITITSEIEVILAVRDMPLGGDAQGYRVPISEIQHITDIQAKRAFLFATALNGLDGKQTFDPVSVPLEKFHSASVETRQVFGPTPYPAAIVSRVESSQDILLLGKSACGKTIAARAAARSLSQAGFAVYWLDLSLPDARISQFVTALANVPTGTPVVLFVDDVQAGPAEAAKIERLRRLIGINGSKTFSTVLIGWRSARRALEEMWPSAAVISVLPDKAMAAILAPLKSFSAPDLQQLQNLVGGDLVAAASAVRFLKRENRFATSDELAFEELGALCGDLVLTEEDARLLLRASALAQFEIDPSANYLEQMAPDAFRRLLSRRILRRAGNYVSVGHRSTARLAYRALSIKFPAISAEIGDPGHSALEYLQNTSSAQLINTLERLDIAALEKTGSEQHGTRFLAKLWSTLQALLRFLDRSGTKDPTWRDDTGSVAFAVRSLSEFGLKSAEPAASFQRKRWSFANSAIEPVPLDHPPNERKDFVEIRQCMVEEEAHRPWRNPAETVERLDFDKMHRTWCIGLLLALETAPFAGNLPRVRQLTEIARNVQLPSGAFYPARVPWVTARVLIGLAQSGEDATSSEVVARACEWLLSDSPSGPFEFGAWPPHTGAWNTVVGTSAMCLNALVRCGVQPDNYAMDLGTNYLLGSRSEWGRPGNEIDCAFAVETLLLAGFPWREFMPELRKLIDWSQDPTIWTEVVLDATQAKDESLKVPLISASLLSIIWGIVRAELPLLLEDLAFGALLPAPITSSSYRSEIQRILSRLEEIQSNIKQNIDSRVARLTRSSPGAEAIREKLEAY